MSDTGMSLEDLERELTELRLRIRQMETREADFTQAEMALARLATFPEQNPNPVIETNLQGEITFLNPAALSHFPDHE